MVGRMPGVHLNDSGRQQAEALAARLDGIPIDAIYSSPLERAVETAAPLAAARGLAVTAQPGLLEVDYGAWTGQPYKALRKTELWRRVQQRPADARFPGGEAMREAEARIVGTLEQIALAHPKGTVAAFSHSDVIKAAVAHLVGLHLDLLQRLAVAPTSVSALYVGDPHPYLLHLNDTGSLRDLVPPPRRGRRRARAEN
jgi:probable phosphoglycerate mutase